LQLPGEDNNGNISLIALQEGFANWMGAMEGLKMFKLQAKGGRKVGLQEDSNLRDNNRAGIFIHKGFCSERKR